MGPLDVADIEELKVKQGQQRDKIENAPKDKAIKASGKAHKAGNITDEEHVENLKNAPTLMESMKNAIYGISDFATDSIEDAKKFEDMRNPLNWGSNIGALGLRAIDAAIPKTPQELQAELVELKAAGAAYPALKLAKEIPIVKKGLGKLDEATINLRKNLLASIKGDQILLDGTILKSEQTERMATGFKENIDKIPKKNRATDSEFTISKIDEFAKVTKPKLKKYVDKFGGTDADLDEIFKEYVVKRQSGLKAKAWLNKYWKELNKGIGAGGLKNARLQIVDDKLKLVDGRTKKTIEHPFELDHSKAKELMYELGLEGADMSDNLDIVYSEWNRAKNNIGNPAIPDDILEAIGQSTTLENFVRRRLDESFMLAGERVPQRFKESAKTGMMDAVQNMKPGETITDIVERELQFWDKYSNHLVEIDDYVPAKVQRELDAQTNLNAIEYLQELKSRGGYANLTSKLKHKYERLAKELEAEFRALSQPSKITTERGYGANEASKWGRFWSGRSD
tara:strand:+ start:1068 stop:2600 length:1533 start_codon:yes stop_codon:yes gene_type:complete